MSYVLLLSVANYVSCDKITNDGTIMFLRDVIYYYTSDFP